ncbi:MAG: succinylglutamate desuccinylase/aspartoacylase family protein [Cyclobacteriaceae bacterium]|nr:succinylglutamate desuccinylase/aspartoacylase family protein [Cyclobacteriaceae bacterium]
MNRILGVFEGNEEGPLVVIVGALHGNETTGVRAIINVFRSIEERNIEVKGKIIGFIGNTKAYESNVRFHDYDLNRCWSDVFVEKLKETHYADLESAEDSELLELLGEIEAVNKGNFTKKVFVDLHATSSDNGNFIVIPEDEANNSIVKSLKLPIVIDLEKYLAGTLLEYVHKKGFISFAFEGGLIGSEKALNLHTSGIWELLYAAGSVERRHDHEFQKYDQIIESFIHELPHKVSVLYHHIVKNGDSFKMKPGYHNFQPVKKGEVLAMDRRGDIKSDYDGLIFMPLYQDKGEDGFFIVKKIEGHI